jgi:hypothetical protein
MATEPMSTANITIAYDGEALRNGEMDVRALAPALLALGNLFDSANSVLNTPQTKMNISVKATSVGSFEIVLQITQTLAQQVSDFFSSTPTYSAKDIITLLTSDTVDAILNATELATLGANFGGLYYLIRKWRGKAATSATDLENGLVRVVVNDETYEVPVALFKLYQDEQVRRAVKATLDPLTLDGVESFEVRDTARGEKVTVMQITRADISSFTPPGKDDEIILQTVERKAFSIVSLTFKEDNKWRLYDGNTTISAVIKDDAFLASIDANATAFAKGDILLCKVEMTQTNTANGLKTEFSVIEVEEHKPASRQLRLL